MKILSLPDSPDIIDFLELHCVPKSQPCYPISGR